VQLETNTETSYRHNIWLPLQQMEIQYSQGLGLYAHASQMIIPKLEKVANFCENEFRTQSLNFLPTPPP